MLRCSTLQCEEALRKLDSDLSAERQRAAQLDGQVKVSPVHMLKVTASSAVTATVQCSQQDRSVYYNTYSCVLGCVWLRRQARDKELERLTRQLDAGRDHSSSAAVVAGKEAAGLKEAAAKAEAALATARARITELEVNIC